MFKFNFIAGLLTALLAGIGLIVNVAIAADVASAVDTVSDSDIKIGLTLLPQMSIPGAKVRTSGAIELLAVDRAEINNLSLVDANSAIKKLKNNEINAWVGVLKTDVNLPGFLAVNELDWSVSPVVIMRTDSDIKSWQDIRNRSVCISKDNRFIGELEQHYGAIESIYPTVTDALLALRTGACDATLQEEDFVNELLNYPEWQKFSARLQPYKNVNLVELQLADNVYDQQLTKLFDTAELRSLVKYQAKDIAFEVYLDQTVPDCH